jgi:hypothetical protein
MEARSAHDEGKLGVTDEEQFIHECIKRLALCADVLTAEEMINRVEFL